MLLPTPNCDVVYKRVMDGAVLLSTTDEVYYGLNAVGALVWEQLPPTLTRLDELCARLAGQYPDVAAETIRADVVELLEDLLAHGLVRAADGATYAETESAAAGQVDAAVTPRVG